MGDDVFDPMIINQGLKSRTSKSGKQTFSVSVTAEPIIINTGPAAFIAPVAQAVAHHLKERMRGISETASKATLKARKAAEMAMQAGKPWATKRYAGGRIGAMPPNKSDRLFNDSGRFADGLVAAYVGKDGTFRINVPANRLDPSTTSDGQAGVARIWQRLVQLIPEFADAGKLMENDVIRATAKRSMSNMIKKAKATQDKLAVDAVRGLFNIASSVSRILGGAA